MATNCVEWDSLYILFHIYVLYRNTYKNKKKLECLCVLLLSTSVIWKKLSVLGGSVVGSDGIRAPGRANKEIQYNSTKYIYKGLYNED